MAAGWEIELAHYYFLALFEFQGAGDFADAVRGAVDYGYFVGLRADELGEGAADGFVLLHPDAPGNSVFVPEAHELLQAVFDVVGKRAFGAGAEMDLLLEYREMRADF